MRDETLFFTYYGFPLPSKELQKLFIDFFEKLANSFGEHLELILDRVHTFNQTQ